MGAENKSGIRMIVASLSVIAAAGVVGWLLLRYGMPQYCFRFYPLVPAWFIVLGTVVSAVMWRGHRRMGSRAVVNMYMVIRMAKLLLTLALVGLYYIAAGERMKEFCLTVAVFYFIYLFVETYLFYRFEKLKKEIR